MANYGKLQFSTLNKNSIFKFKNELNLELSVIIYTLVRMMTEVSYQLVQKLKSSFIYTNLILPIMVRFPIMKKNIELGHLIIQQSQIYAISL